MFWFPRKTFDEVDLGREVPDVVRER